MYSPHADRIVRHVATERMRFKRCKLLGKRLSTAVKLIAVSKPKFSMSSNETGVPFTEPESLVSTTSTWRRWSRFAGLASFPSSRYVIDDLE
jgi:hypothetical protein